MGQKQRPFKCPENLFWYLVGLIAADGNLSSDGRRIDITGDRQHLTQLRDALAIQNRVTRKENGSGGYAWHIQIGSRNLYEKLLCIGLTPRKSWTIGALKVPEHRFPDFLRGVIDGDGNIMSWNHPTNGREQWRIRIVGVSKPFLSWISETIERLWYIKGAIHKSQNPTRQFPLYTLKYGKLSARVISSKCYYPRALSLERKRKLAERCFATPVGWTKSKTILHSGIWKNCKYVHAYGSKEVSRVLDNADVFTKEFDIECSSRGDGMADVGALKASVRKDVRVRLPPPV